MVVNAEIEVSGDPRKGGCETWLPIGNDGRPLTALMTASPSLSRVEYRCCVASSVAL